MRTWYSRLITAVLLLIAGLALLWPPVLWSLLVVAPLVGIGLYDRCPTGVATQDPYLVRGLEAGDRECTRDVTDENVSKETADESR
ncbi:hypothetical protein [Thiohalobacter thiocyanaticus]|uniref:Uncharacterized protein n=1 Tax=Thiohalobacter thiocyanaticus TaxID=585455 RepID=A0A426QIE3_9GAMM|nr:hypothetical protein [Thiohalobacter thiocyanaticus]RRQ21534.1 hypothetical protein D6C00_06000 [Thiohalobacter thiocyanaticus]